MAAISTHLHHKPYQVASTTDPSLPHRKWDHRGTYHAPTHRSAAYNAHKGESSVVPRDGAVVHPSAAAYTVFRFSCGLYMSVGF